MGDFYASETDAQLAKDIVSQSADLYIMPKHPMTSAATGVMNKAVPAATVITPAVVPAPAWVVDELIGNIVVLQDDNGLANEYVIADNDATSFTIDLTSTVDGNDYSANYTNAATFAFWIWDAEEFLGYTEGADEFNDEDENKQFKRGVPREQIREDLLENVVTTAIIVRTPGHGNLMLGSNLDDSKSNATYWVLEKGSNPPARPYYYFIFKNKNVNGDLQQLRLYMNQVTLNGARVLGGGDEYESLPLLITSNVDTLRGDETDGTNISNKYRVRIAK
jgi:hypothetical protein